MITHRPPVLPSVLGLHPGGCVAALLATAAVATSSAELFVRKDIPGSDAGRLHFGLGDASRAEVGQPLTTDAEGTARLTLSVEDAPRFFRMIKP